MIRGKWLSLNRKWRMLGCRSSISRAFSRGSELSRTNNPFSMRIPAVIFSILKGELICPRSKTFRLLMQRTVKILGFCFDFD